MELACLPTHRHKEGLRCTVLDVGQKRAQSSSREQGPCRTMFLCAGQRSTAETGQESEGPVRGPVLLVTVIQITGTSVMQGPVLLLARRPLRITQASGALLQSLYPGSNAAQICRSCVVTPEVTSEYRQDLSSGRL